MILFVKSTNLFLMRHPNGSYLKWSNPDDVSRIQWSKKLIQHVSSKFKKVLIFNDVVRENEKVVVWPRINIRLFIRTELPKLSNIEIIDFRSDEPELAMEKWKKCVLYCGGRWNTRLTHLNTAFNNIECYVDGGHIFWVGEKGDQDIDIIPEKYNSFMDLAKIRESKTTW